jgi:ATP-dependent Lhr-like helicase
MKDLYLSDAVPRYLDRAAQSMLGEGRAAFRRLGLADQAIIGWGMRPCSFLGGATAS